jgi:dipeptidyl aminopeptidase/acylaminoacyl peptidase
MSSRVVALVVFNVVALVAVVFLASRVIDDDGGDEEDAVETADDGDDTVAFEVGDLVEITTPGGCAALEVLDESQLPPLAVPCAGDEAVFEVADGPQEAETGRAWLLSGFGWVHEDVLTEIDTDPRAQIQIGQLIAFIDSEKDLYVMEADGGGRRMVAEGPVERYSWSPDGQSIVFGTHDDDFIENERAVLVDLDGTVRWEAEGVNSFGPLAWSPDGTMVAASSVAGEGNIAGGLLVLAASDGDLVLALTDAQFSSWSADSSRIGFRRFDTTELEGIDYAAIGAVVDLENGSVADLIPGGPSYSSWLFGLPLFRPGLPSEIAYAGLVITLDTGEELQLPAPVVKWSPNGSLAVLALQRPDFFLGHQYSLYELSPSPDQGGFSHYIALPSCQCDAEPWAFVDEMLFSPDGRYFLSTNADDFFTPQRQLVPLDRSGQELPRLPAFGFTHQFSADSEYLLVSSGNSTPDAGWIFVMPIDEERVIVLGRGIAPSWQPTN